VVVEVGRGWWNKVVGERIFIIMSKEKWRRFKEQEQEQEQKQKKAHKQGKGSQEQDLIL
jgi:hypothetical protein